MHYDAVVVGAGLSGLTAGALMAKRGLRVAVVDRATHPGGSCSAFKRGDALHDQGAAMLFGFGRQGFNPHRFVFNVLEEPIDIIQHEAMYAMEFAGKRIIFTPDLACFTDDLAQLFPTEREAIKRFYADLETLYSQVIIASPEFTTPDEMDGRRMLPHIKAHPRSYLKFLRFMNMSVEKLLRRYFRDPTLFQFFDKLCSTYCYTTAAETPAVLGAVMFVDNHVGGTFYPAGSTLMVPGKLEKVIEDHGGTMLMGRDVERLEFDGDAVCGVTCRSITPRGVAHNATAATASHVNVTPRAERLEADAVIYAGNVWSLYEQLLPRERVNRKERRWVERLVPTASSAVVYLSVTADGIPPGTLPVEMFAEHPDRLADDEITAYLMSLDDPSLCPAGTQVLTVVGPCFESPEGMDRAAYEELKQRLAQRFIGVLEQRWPGFTSSILHCEVATPTTLARYAGKYCGAVAGPKQMMGQHLLKRQHTRTRWQGLYCCGESTVMGTGTPTVTISGIAAANAVLEHFGLEPFRWKPNLPEYVRDLPRGAESTAARYAAYAPADVALVRAAERCRYCEHPRCRICQPQLDVPGIMRRTTVGNFDGARRLAAAGLAAAGLIRLREPAHTHLKTCERACIRTLEGHNPVPLAYVVESLITRK